MRATPVAAMVRTESPTFCLRTPSTWPNMGADPESKNKTILTLICRGVYTYSAVHAVDLTWLVPCVTQFFLLVSSMLRTSSQDGGPRLENLKNTLTDMLISSLLK